MVSFSNYDKQQSYHIPEKAANEIYRFLFKDFMMFFMKKFRPPLLAAIASLITFVFLVYLGNWQLHRLQWKTALLDKIHTNMAMAPAPLPEKIAHPAKWEYRRVTMTGTYIYQHNFLVMPRTWHGQNGFYMMTPFQRISGGTVIVNRGWVSQETLAKVKEPHGIVELHGIITLPHKTSFTPQNVPEKNQWFWPDLKAMARAAHVTDVAPVIFTLDKTGPGVYPVGGMVRTQFPNHHLQYAIFWFLMALASQVAFFLRFRQE